MIASNESLAIPLEDPLSSVKQVSGRCIINNSDKLYCWGSYAGDGTTTVRQVPVPVNNNGLLGDVGVKSVSGSCAINNQGRLYCWGRNGTGQIGDGTTDEKTVPVLVNNDGLLGGEEVVSVSAGSDYNCAINSEGKLYCWGYNSYGQLGSGKGSTIPALVNNDGLLGGEGVVSVSAGYEHACAINSEGKLYCWGRNISLSPVLVNNDGLLGGEEVVSVSAGYDHTCAINSERKLYCWGDNSDGQLGDNTTVAKAVPVLVNTDGFLDGEEVVSVSVGSRYTCAVNSEGKLYCWGENEDGQLGIGSASTYDWKSPQLVGYDGLLGGLGVKSVSGSCAINNENKLYCWGKRSFLYSTTDTEKIKTPVPVYDLSQESRTGTLSGRSINNENIDNIATGNSHTCAINSENKLYCWGKNEYGQLGIFSNDASTVPAPVYDGGFYQKGIIRVDAGSFHTCSINSQGTLYCWGRNNYGQLGNNTQEDRTIPTQVYYNDYNNIVNDNVVSVSVGGDHTCAITNENKLYCWGNNNSGQLGDGTNVSKTQPILVNNPTYFYPWSRIDSGDSHTCATNSSGSLKCWGNNTYGQLGDGTKNSKNTPISVPNFGNVKKFSTGSYHTCAIKSDNRLYCWGKNTYGQLGNGTETDSTNPTLIKNDGLLGGVGVKYVIAGTSHTCAINLDNKLYCWGLNYSGQLGDGTQTNRKIPTLVNNDGFIDGLEVKNLNVGENHTCVVNSEDKLYCWGDNSFAQCTKGELIYSVNILIPNLISHCGITPSNYEVGENCNAGVGVCSRAGNWECVYPELREIECAGDVSYANRKGEICSNNLDDNCDGIIDETKCTINDCSTDLAYSLISNMCDVGVGACNVSGTYYCDINDEVVCDATPGSPGDELCNEIDDDCDGVTDENFDKGTACTVGVGGCRRTGEKICSNDMLTTVCNVVAGTPGTEICGDTIDNDCDEATDEGDCVCTDSQNLIDTDCSDGNGVCKSYGKYVCNKSTGAVECNAVANSSAQTIEICGDEKDNDCDGTIDESDCSCLDSNNLLDTECSAGVGACKNFGINICNKSTGEIECNAVAGSAGIEICADNIDNDCDSATDEDDCVCTDPDNLLNTECSAGVGVCKNLGVNVCNKVTGTVECNVVAGTAGTETCTNMGSDDDCDGTTDNIPNLGESCTGESVGAGACANNQGIYACNGDEFVCLVNALSSGAEICADTIDNDCDGTVDEADCICIDPNHLLNTSCSAGVGACENSGKNVCNTATGKIECNAVAGTAGTEICGDNIDNDCDGTKDENDCICLDPNNLLDTECSVGVGACNNPGKYVCNEKTGQIICNAIAKTTGVETCANIGSDDDCDGVTDNISNLGQNCTGETVGIGACANTQGTYVCNGDNLVCQVEALPAVTEICGDNKDNDCDGEVDEGCIVDLCPADPNKIEPGVCGCGKLDVDSDGDGVLDCYDGCPNDPNNKDLNPPEAGCFVNESEVPEKYDPKVVIPSEHIVTPKTKLLSPYVVKKNAKAFIYLERFVHATLDPSKQSNKKTTFRYEVRVVTNNKGTRIKTSKIVKLKSTKNKLSIKLKAKVTVKVQYRVVIIQGKKKKNGKWSKNLIIKK